MILSNKSSTLTFSSKVFLAVQITGFGLTLHVNEDILDAVNSILEASSISSLT